MATTINTKHAVAHLKRADPVLKKIIEAVGPPDLRKPSPTAFQSLARSIVFQQLSGKAANTILSRFTALFHDSTTEIETDANFFPKPEHVLATTTETMRSAGISRQKAAALRNLAAFCEKGTLEMDSIGGWSDEEVIAHLLPIQGVGQWTAQMFLMFQLGRPDVLPTSDVGLNRAIARLYGLPRPATPEEVKRIGAPWHPWATIACWYLWRSEDVLLPLAESS